MLLLAGYHHPENTSWLCACIYHNQVRKEHNTAIHDPLLCLWPTYLYQPDSKLSWSESNWRLPVVLVSTHSVVEQRLYLLSDLLMPGWRDLVDVQLQSLTILQLLQYLHTRWLTENNSIPSSRQGGKEQRRLWDYLSWGALITEGAY